MRKLLLGSVVAVALLTGCGDDNKKESSKTAGTAQEVKKEEVASNNQNSTPAPIKEDIRKIDEAKETTTTVNQTKGKLIIAPDKVEGEIKEVTTQASVDTSIDATVLFTTCAACHGQKAEKSALGKSQVIAGWDKQRIVDAINGYKEGTYGGIMKNVMAGYVMNKTDVEIDALAELISKM
jgi:cytochrome c553